MSTMLTRYDNIVGPNFERQTMSKQNAEKNLVNTVKFVLVRSNDCPRSSPASGWRKRRFTFAEQNDHTALESIQDSV